MTAENLRPKPDGSDQDEVFEKIKKDSRILEVNQPGLAERVAIAVAKKLKKLREGTEKGRRGKLQRKR